VAKHVPGKTAQECHDEHTRGFPTPAVIARKAEERRRRPATPTGRAAGKGEGDEMEDDGLSFSSGKVGPVLVVRGLLLPFLLL